RIPAVEALRGKAQVRAAERICAGGTALKSEVSFSLGLRLGSSEFGRIDLPIANPESYPAETPAVVSVPTLRRNSAAASGSTVLMNIPDPSSNPATRVSRGITLTYQWKW